MKCSLTSGSGYCWDDSWSLVHHWAGLHNKQDLGTRTHQSLGWWCLNSGCFSCSSTFLVPCTNLACWSLNWGNCQWMQSNPINDVNVNDEVDVDIVGVDTHVSLLKVSSEAKFLAKQKFPLALENIGEFGWQTWTYHILKIYFHFCQEKLMRPEWDLTAIAELNKSCSLYLSPPHQLYSFTL